MSLARLVSVVSALAALGLANPTWQGWSPHGNYPPPPPPPPPPPSPPPASSPVVTTSSSAVPPPATSSCAGYFEPLAPPFLNDLAQAAGKLWFGSATDQPGTGEDTNILYQEILNDTHIFGQITPANMMKFQLSEPEPGIFNFTGGDINVALAQDHGKYLRCHNLVWVSQVSDWVLDGNWTADGLTAVMKNHIQTMIAHFGGACYSWDVVNEAIAANGSFAESIWFDVIGPEYFFLAYQFAQEAVDALPAGTRKPKLYYNDFGIESGNKSVAVLGLIQQLRNQGLRIDGVGLESHFVVGETPSLEDQIATKQAYIAAGVEVAITELDIRFEQANLTNATAFALQAEEYYNSTASCVQVEGCVGITVWDFDDQYSWIPSSFPGQGLADLYNADFRRKPAYYAVGEALQGVPCTVCSA
ncbi:glycosyl hydrolase family 10 [Fonsecaea erecta]|uniref:Beta-xylanase n=1 Tax=Fonsecaea erecta TaxID=1367422 RepID=A0A178Z9D4_9EURO|nr:glycosyl hydrolase family 10 [Fonsecaea erecta]OAP56398.1 glycosyl hydrolase family 10 [Fonsecaea erecta]